MATKVIRLTTDMKDVVFVNTQSIKFFYTSADRGGKTVISFGKESGGLTVIETAEEIAAIINDEAQV